jgi:hypothetical protein
VAQLAADRRELERTVEALLAKKDVLRTQIAELEVRSFFFICSAAAADRAPLY